MTTPHTKDKDTAIDNLPLSADYDSFIKQAKIIAKNRVFTSPLTTYAYGIDASCYTYRPRVVIIVHNEHEVTALIKLANIYKTPITFRAAGSSLSGQALSDSVLIIANDGFKGIEILDNGKKVALQCGVIGSDANLALKGYGAKIGPDPATINTALIGGIVSNNSSGMCCGIEENSYKTIDSVRIVLNDGTLLDTSSESSLQSFHNTHAHIIQALLELREEILQDAELQDIIKHKYKIKNTTGFSINALVDFSNIRDIINHLVVGSEGTLCFISKVILHSVREYMHKASCLLFFKDIYTASLAITRLAKLDRRTLIATEIMDYECLLSASSLSEFTDILDNLEPNTTCILLQTQSDDIQGINTNLDIIKSSLQDIPNNRESLFSSEEKECTLWWKMRKSLLPLSAKNRPKGSIVITEDICFHIDRFCEGVELIQKLFNKHAFKGIVFGHALSGNLHFIITPNLANNEEVERFKTFMEDLAHGVATLSGSIKAEHGTGRMVAPFVELEWGQRAYSIHKRVKEIFDSMNLFNPNVIITQDKDIYAKHFKHTAIRLDSSHIDSTSDHNTSYAIANLANKSEEIASFIENCMDCGFCERACPSKFLTLTPRQRIASIKEIKRLQDSSDAEDRARAGAMLEEYQYYGITTCATCSMCSTLCPIEIDTANIATILQRTSSNSIARIAYNNMHIVLKLAKGMLYTGNALQSILGKQRAFRFSNAFHHFMLDISKKYNINVASYMPILPHTLPSVNNYTLQSKIIESYNEAKTAISTNPSKTIHIAKEEQDSNIKEIIYFSTCMNRTVKPPKDSKDIRSLQEIIESICKKANISLIYPKNIHKLCCGKAFSSIEDINKHSLLANQLLHESKGGNITIVIDHSACYAHMIKEVAKSTTLKIMDITQFLYEITKHMHFKKISKDIIVHQMCTLKKTRKEQFIVELSKKCSDNVYIIKSMECCGFSGYKGILHPELNQSSLKDLELEIEQLPNKCNSQIHPYIDNAIESNSNNKHNRFYAVSSSITCEIGLSHYSRLQFQNIAYLVDSCLQA